MKSNYITYSYINSFARIDSIIASSDNSFEELSEIPSRDRLTFNNGFYVYCTALYVDIRNSSKLPSKHTRPKLAKLYRSYISEIVAVINGNAQCAEVTIEGDCVWGIFNTTQRVHIDNVFSTAAEISSLINVLNYKFAKKGIEQITVGIGIHYGRALMVKAGYNGSSINDVVWMGDVLNEASKLCGYGNKEYYDRGIMVSDVIYDNLNEENKSFLERNVTRDCYHGNVVMSNMDKWYLDNCK